MGKQKGGPKSIANAVEQSKVLDDSLQEEDSSQNTTSDNANDEQTSPFSSYLRYILRHDRAEITRIANELEVAENTIYRWINGSTDPRPVYLKRLLEVLPHHRSNLTYAINSTFPGILDTLTTEVREVPRDIYRRVLELASITVEDDDRRWQITQAIFEHALLHMDAQRQGLSIMYAKLIPSREDGFHSLYEVDMRGTYPWPFTLDCKVYLGNTTLAGRAAITQRLQTWDDLDEESRLPIMVDDFERSSCSCPVMHAGRIAGVLTISSTQPGFFAEEPAYRAAIEYARLFSLGLNSYEFYACSNIQLKPMPNFKWQRTEISNTYMNRVIICARKRKLSLPEAEEFIRREMEEEFLKIGQQEAEKSHNLQFEQTRGINV